jgi:hypothetical protein
MPSAFLRLAGGEPPPEFSIVHAELERRRKAWRTEVTLVASQRGISLTFGVADMCDLSTVIESESGLVLAA